MLVYVRVQLQRVGEVYPPVAQVVVVNCSPAEVNVCQSVIERRMVFGIITLQDVPNSSDTEVQSFIESLSKFLDIQSSFSFNLIGMTLLQISLINKLLTFVQYQVNLSYLGIVNILSVGVNGYSSGRFKNQLLLISLIS